MSAARRTGAAAVVVVTAAALLAGCGGDDGPGTAADGYCGDVQDAKDSFIALLDNHIDQDAFEHLRDQLHTIAAEAPSSIQGDWQTVSSSVDAFSTALDAAGLTMEEMQAMGSGPMGGGAAMRQAMDAAAALGSAAFSTAQSNVRRNASTQCQVDFGA